MRENTPRAPTELWGQLPLVPRRWTEVAHYISAPFSQTPAPGGLLCSHLPALAGRGSSAWSPGWSGQPSCSPKRGWRHKETLPPMCSPRTAFPSKALRLSGRAGVNDYCISFRAQPSWLVKGAAFKHSW